MATNGKTARPTSGKIRLAQNGTVIRIFVLLVRTCYLCWAKTLLFRLFFLQFPAPRHKRTMKTDISNPMKKLLLLCPLALLTVGCFDRDYDLSDLDTEHIAIGDDASCFDLPLANIKVALDDIHDDKGSLRQMLAEADVWLPSALPGDTDYVDLHRVRTEDAYLDTLLDALIDEMTSDEEKLAQVADLAWSDYRIKFLGTLNLPAGVTEAQFLQTFKAQFRTGTLSSAIRTKTEESARNYLTALDVETLEYELGELDLGDALDMLVDNLDPEGTPDPVNTLSIEGEVVSSLPLTLNLSPSFDPADIRISTFLIEADATTQLPSTRIYAEDLRRLSRASNVTVRVPVDLQRYYPGTVIDQQTPVTIRLSLRKTGALNLELRSTAK